jgi:hypothetical protein
MDRSHAIFLAVIVFVLLHLSGRGRQHCVLRRQYGYRANECSPRYQHSNHDPDYSFSQIGQYIDGAFRIGNEKPILAKLRVDCKLPGAKLEINPAFRHGIYEIRHPQIGMGIDPLHQIFGIDRFG